VTNIKGMGTQKLFGDMNSDGSVDLADSIIPLQIMTGNSSINIDFGLCVDVNLDEKVSLEESIYVLQDISELRN